MRNFMRIGLTFLIILAFTGASAYADGGINLKLDGEIIKTDTPPVIENERTLVPYRALLESMGAEVSWEQEAGMATAILGGQRVQVTINSNTAFVNGAKKAMDVPPRIINNRTMIPLRFVLENLSCTVDWVNESRTVVINSPQKNSLTEVGLISFEETDHTYRIIARGSSAIKGTRTFAYDGPERYGVDIHNAVYNDKVGSINATNEIINNIRFSQFDQGTVRIVVDLNDKVAGKVSFSDDRSTVYIDFEKNGKEGNGENSQGEPGGGGDIKDPGDINPGLLPELDWRASGKLIAIDPGHGGKDPGSAGKIGGRTVIAEKDLNLAIALRLHQLLTQAGANAVLLRDSDATMALYDRPEAANQMNADLLVSVHNNSAETQDPNGTEVLYYDKVGLEAYGITSKEIATLVQKELLLEIGLKDRGIKNSPHLAVLNKSLMPAIIIEGGFLSNMGDLNVMLKEEYKEAYALSVARGIINSLNLWADK